MSQPQASNKEIGHQAEKMASCVQTIDAMSFVCIVLRK